MNAVATGAELSHRRCTQRVSCTDRAAHSSISAILPRVETISGFIDAYDQFFHQRLSMTSIQSASGSISIVLMIVFCSKSFTLFLFVFGSVINAFSISIQGA
jgi:hypothetical protein